MPQGSSVPVSHRNLYIAAGIAAVLLVVGLAYFAYSLRTSAPALEPYDPSVQPQAQTDTQLGGGVTASDAVPAAAPSVNPVESANPFNDTNTSATTNTNTNTSVTNNKSQNNDYQNPFQ